MRTKILFAVSLVAVLGSILFATWKTAYNTAYEKGIASLPSSPRYHLPSLLNINGERWHTFPYDFSGEAAKKIGLSGYAGYTDCDARNIYYTEKPQPEAFARENMWHEIGHALRCNKKDAEKSNWYGNTNKSIEHETVYEFGMGMSSFVHDNPDFIKWAENWEER